MHSQLAVLQDSEITDSGLPYHNYHILPNYRTLKSISKLLENTFSKISSRLLEAIQLCTQNICICSRYTIVAGYYRIMLAVCVSIYLSIRTYTSYSPRLVVVLMSLYSIVGLKIGKSWCSGVKNGVVGFKKIKGITS